MYAASVIDEQKMNCSSFVVTADKLILSRRLHLDPSKIRAP